MASAQKREPRPFWRLCESDGVKSRDEAETNSTKERALGDVKCIC
jgi:hypothetical protein